MKQIHIQEKEQFKKLFKQDQIDQFEDRFKVLEVFLQTERHLTASEFIELLEQNGHKYTPDFVTDTLKMMCRFGFAQKSRFNNGLVRYEHRHLGQHHDHMICIRCKKIIEFENEPLETLQARIASNHGFHILQHKMEMYGICSECLGSRTHIIPLAAAKQGEQVTVNDFTGGSKLQMRLLSMGLRPGDVIKIITNQSYGPLVVAADSKRFVLGRKMANKILVQPDK